MKNLITPLVLGKVSKKYNLTPQNSKLYFFSKMKKTSWLAIHRHARKIELKQSLVAQEQNQLQEK